MSSQFNKSYRVTSNTALSAELWNGVFQNIDQRILGIEEKKPVFAHDLYKQALEKQLDVRAKQQQLGSERQRDGPER